MRLQNLATLSSISSADLVRTNGFGSSLFALTNPRMARSQEADVGVKCK
jgi:hypothetical protein